MGGDSRAANLLGCWVSPPAEVGVRFCLNETHYVFRPFGERVCSHGEQCWELWDAPRTGLVNTSFLPGLTALWE